MQYSEPALGAREPRTDHPLIQAYEGSTIRRKTVTEFDEYAAFTGMDATGKEPTSLSLEGKITKILYTAPKNRSVLEVFRNYEAAVLAAGAEIIYTCDQKKKECVARYAGPTLQKLSDIHSISNLAGRYLLAKLQQEEQTAYIAVAVGPASSTIHVIEVREMETGKVTLDASALGKGLDSRGFVIVEGIFFDTDKATLKDSSTPALEQVAALLEQRTTLELYVVGHTDNQGKLNYNLGLSQRRAASVVRHLVERYGINAARLSGHGVGPLAPATSNASESGRAKNRRVVIVSR
ncbi:MAG: OmpA family protein [Pseudomonadota bacterium]